MVPEDSSPDFSKENEPSHNLNVTSIKEDVVFEGCMKDNAELEDVVVQEDILSSSECTAQKPAEQDHFHPTTVQPVSVTISLRNVSVAVEEINALDDRSLNEILPCANKVKNLEEELTTQRFSSEPETELLKPSLLMEQMQHDEKELKKQLNIVEQSLNEGNREIENIGTETEEKNNNQTSDPISSNSSSSGIDELLRKSENTFTVRYENEWKKELSKTDRTPNRQSVELRALQNVGDANLLSSIDTFFSVSSSSLIEKSSRDTYSAVEQPTLVPLLPEEEITPKKPITKLSPRPEYCNKETLPHVVSVRQPSPIPSIDAITPTNNKTQQSPKMSPHRKSKTPTSIHTSRGIQRSNTISTMNAGEKKTPHKRTSLGTTSPTVNGLSLASESYNKRPNVFIKKTTPKNTVSKSQPYFEEKHGDSMHNVYTEAMFTKEDLERAYEEGRQQTLSEWSIVQMEYDQLEKEFREQKIALESFRKEVTNAGDPNQKRIREMERELKQLRDAEKHMNESFALERTRHTTELLKQREKIEEELNVKISDIRRTLEDHYDVLRRELESKLEVVNGQVKLLTCKNADLITDNKKLKVHKDVASKLQSDYKTALIENKTLQNERQQLLNDKHQLLQLELAGKKRIQDLEKKLSELQTSSKKLKEDNTILKHHVEELERTKKENEAELLRLNNDVSNLKKKAEDFDKIKKEKEVENLHIKGQIYDAVVEIDNLKKSVSQLTEQLTQQELANLTLQEEKNRNNKEWEDICNELLRKCEMHGILSREDTGTLNNN